MNQSGLQTEQGHTLLDTRTRWFGGGGHGGYNDNWSWVDSVIKNYNSNTQKSDYAAINGYIGGGGARFGPPSLSGSDNPSEFSQNLYPFCHFQNGRANTGGGGCGGSHRSYSNNGNFPAGSGGSGIAIIRYQVAH